MTAKKTGDRTLIVYAHPYDGSFNHAVLEAATSALDKAGRPYDVVDLYADGFDPRMPAEELALFSEGGTLDPLVSHYQQLIEGACRIIIICPIWWSDMPAIVKGFIDKVFLRTFAYMENRAGLLEGRLDIDEALVISTSAAPTLYLKSVCGNFITKAMLGHTMKGVGARRRRWVNCGKANLIMDEKRRAFLKDLGRYI